MNELLKYVSQLMDYIEQNESSLDQATQQELAVFLQEVWQFIEQYNQQNPVEALPAQDGPELDNAPYPSSNVNAFKYDYKTGRLLVKFMGKDTPDSGPVYSYEGVPKFIYDVFSRGAVPPKTSGKNKWHRWEKGIMPSLGAAMYHLIRSNYPYQRLN
jgi:hypothetical protein